MGRGQASEASSVHTENFIQLFQPNVTCPVAGEITIRQPQDVRDREARASFEQALEGMRNVAPLSLSIAVFCDATSFKTKRRDFFQRLRSQAEHVVKVESTPDNKLSFTREKNTPSGLTGKFEVHYGENRPYFRSTDSTSRTLEKVPARLAAGRPSAFRPALPCSTLTPSTAACTRK